MRVAADAGLGAAFGAARAAAVRRHRATPETACSHPVQGSDLV